MTQIVILFLLGMAVLAIYGRLRNPLDKRSRKTKCPACGRHLIGKGPCACGKGT